jgi:hypothetical protein
VLQIIWIWSRIVSDDGNFESDPSVGFMGRPV